MGLFKINNTTDNTSSASVCNPYQFGWNLLCSYSTEYTVKQYDKLTLYYDFGFDPQVTPSTKVHYVCKELGRDLKISPAGADLMNSSGYCNPWLAEDLSAGNYSIYAYDEYHNLGTPIITLTVTGAAKPIVTIHVTSNPSGADVKVNGTYIDSTPFDYTDPYGTTALTFTFDMSGYDTVTISDNYIKSQTVNANLVKTAVVCKSPSGVDRKCEADNKTMSIWNVVACKYDSMACSTGHCTNGFCDTPPVVTPTGYDCTNCNLLVNNGKYTTSAACTTACKPGTVTPTGYDCTNCNLLVNNGKYTTSAECIAACKPGVVTPTGYDCTNCNLLVNNGKYTTSAACTTECATTGGTVTKPCASDEMSIFGSCQKKNTVYLVGIALFAVIMMNK